MQKIFQKGIQLLFPPQCLCCGTYDLGKWFCASCFPEILFISKQRCLKCGRIQLEKTVMQCSYCQTLSFPFLRTEALFTYQKKGKEALYRLKFGKMKFIGRILGDLLAHRLSGYSPYKRATMVVPIPLHPSREWQRGFNQAEVLGESISKKLQISLVSALKRTKKTSFQSQLNPKERQKNLAKAFVLAIPRLELKNRQIILVDDIFTTGQTLSEATKILLKEGAKKILVAVVAR